MKQAGVVGVGGLTESRGHMKISRRNAITML